MKDRRLVWILGLMIWTLSVIPASSSPEGMLATGLRCEYRINPLGIDTPQPRLSWVLESGERGQKQTAYRVLVADSREKLDQNLGNLRPEGEHLGGMGITVFGRLLGIFPRAELKRVRDAWLDKYHRPAAAGGK